MIHVPNHSLRFHSKWGRGTLDRWRGILKIQITILDLLMSAVQDMPKMNRKDSSPCSKSWTVIGKRKKRICTSPSLSVTESVYTDFKARSLPWTQLSEGGMIIWYDRGVSQLSWDLNGEKNKGLHNTIQSKVPKLAQEGVIEL